MLDKNDKQWLTELFDKRFAEQDARIDEKFDKRFAEQDAKFDKRFAEQDAKFDKRFAEQDAKFDKRFAEQDKKLDELRRQSRSQYEGILEALDKHADEMRKESDARFASMMETMDRRFEEQEGRFGMIIENKVTARLDAFLEYLPGAYKSYDRLEKRVDKIEMRQQILERMVSDHLQEV